MIFSLRRLFEKLFYKEELIADSEEKIRRADEVIRSVHLRQKQLEAHQQILDRQSTIRGLNR